MYIKPEIFLDTDVNFFHLSSYSTISNTETIHTHYVCLKDMRINSRLFFIINGETTFFFNDSNGIPKTIIARKDDIVYLPPNISYTSNWHKNEPIEYVSIEFLAKSTNDSPVLLSDEIFIIVHDKHEYFKTQFLSFYKLYTSGTIGYKFKCRSMFLDILVNIAVERLESNYKNIDLSIYKSVLYLENNYINDISVQELAKMSNLCESSYRSKFKKLKGMTPVEYRNYLKVKKAAELLQNNDYSVTEVAELINLPDICYFNKLFKRYYKISPLHYKHSFYNN